MKHKTIALICAAIFACSGAISTFATISQTPSSSYSNYSPQVCKFSLSSYSGEIYQRQTQLFTVGLSCPQPGDTYATVVVFINNEAVASEVVMVPANCTRSKEVKITVGSDYNGKAYKLSVE